jgi:hypothetical protein
MELLAAKTPKRVAIEAECGLQIADCGTTGGNDEGSKKALTLNPAVKES